MGVGNGVRWALSWVLYWMGDAVSRLMYDPFAGVLYRPYQKLMHWSEVVKGDGPGPWKDAAEDEE